MINVDEIKEIIVYNEPIPNLMNKEVYATEVSYYDDKSDLFEYDTKKEQLDAYEKLVLEINSEG